ncbi:MAG: hypothetical protein DWP98_02290 [Bacteroidetes bacterium]|nr:MAG: hypothetical protein DWP98_02290 [Bacteroidota bacterium]MBL1145297.1 hypothetical protein [Bacteroidota bacterium]NOG58094.1 hypothetical protein [Bacteroidota bacterium]
MKNLKLMASALLITTMASAQDIKLEQVPPSIQKNFKNEYSKAKDVEWELDGELYEVEFEINKMDHEVWYDKDGKVMRLEKEISAKELPSTIISLIKSKYAGFKIDKAQITTTEQRTIYEVELEKGWTEERKVLFDKDGKVLSDFED